MGATLFTMMSGFTVHAGESGRELLVKLMTKPTRSLLEVMPEVPKPVAEVVDRALSVDREQRWLSAEEMRNALADASLVLYEQRAPRTVLTALVASVAPSSLPGPKAFSDPAGLKRSPVPLADPTLRAKERPDMPEDVGKPTVETARAVSHERSQSPPRRRASLLVLAVLALGAASAAIGAVVVQRRGGTTEASSATTGAAAAAPSAAIAPTVVVSSVVVPVDQPTSPVPASASASPAQAAASAAVRSDVARSGRPRSEAKRDADAPLAPSSPPADLESPAPNCNPPFYYDSNSNRVFKKECLQH
jgi:serine/threonine-protein kinase